MRLLLLLVALFGAAIPSICFAFAPSSEPYFGLYGTVCPSPDTTGGRVFSGTVRSSPVPAQQADVVNAYVAAAASGRDTSNLTDATKMPAVTETSCASAVAKLANAEECESLPLYLLGDGEIRQEWRCNGHIIYMLFYTVDQGKVTNVWAMDRTTPPVVVIPRR